MANTMVNALIITGIGMGLVFVAILALWGLMELMVKVTARFAPREENVEEGEVEEAATEAEPVSEAALVEPADDLTGLKRKAAAAAVAMALASASAAELPAWLSSAGARVSTYTSGSAWQAVARGGQLSQSATLYSRKSRGK